MPADTPRKTAKKLPVVSKGNGSKLSPENGRRSRKRVKELFADI